ncbi:MAG: hypothetical protein AB7K09_20255 [Planctomycetota bacterium]
MTRPVGTPVAATALAAIAISIVLACLPGARARAQDQPQTRPNQPEPPVPVPDNVFTVTAVDEEGYTPYIDAGYNNGVVEHMRFRIMRGDVEIARSEVVWTRESGCLTRVIPGTRRERVRVRDTAILLPYIPDLRPPTRHGETSPVPPDPPGGAHTGGNGGHAPKPDNPFEAVERQQLVDIINKLTQELYDAKTDALRLTNQLEDEKNEKLIAQAQVEQSEAGRIARRDQHEALLSEMQRATTFGLGGHIGTTVGDPLCGSFSLGPERFSLVTGASLDVFSLGPIDGIHAWFDLVEQPGIGPTGNGEHVVCATFGFELYLPLRPAGWNTALSIGYRHHHFPVPFLGTYSDSGELVFSWGRRVPMSRERESHSFWSYQLSPIIEWIHAPYGATGTDIRIGVGFPDLITVMMDFNWGYFTGSNAFILGALHVSARVPVVQDHGELGSFRLMLTGDWVEPFDSASTVYRQVFQAGIVLELNYGR